MRRSVVFSSLAVLILAGGIWGWLNKPHAPAPKIRPSANKVVEPSPSDKNSRIAYLKDQKTLVVISPDGSGKNYLSTITSEQGFFRDVSWKNSEEISYIRCDSLKYCAIFSKNLNTAVETKEADPGEFVGQVGIVAFAWSHSGSQLAYIYSLPDTQTRMDLKSGTTKNTVKNFAASFGPRGVGFSDESAIRYSPDDKHLLVVDTFTQPNNGDKNTIWVLENSGKEILAIPSTEGQLATSPFWENSEEFIYSLGQSLFTRKIDSSASKVLVTQATSPHNPTVFDNKIYFWADEETKPKIYEMNKDGSGLKVFIEGFLSPRPVSSTKLSAIKTEKPTGQEMFPFAYSGLSVIDVSSRQIVDLDSGEIGTFAVWTTKKAD